MAQDPNYYHTVHLKDYATVEEATNIVKSMVPPNLAKYVTVDMVRPTYHDPKKREYKLSTLVNFFSNRAKAQKDIESLESWTGVIVGGRDIRKFDQPVEQVKGQNHLMVMDNGEIRSFSGWGHTIGPSGSAVPTPTLQRATVKVAPREFTFSNGEKGMGYDGKMVVESTAIPEGELKKFLTERAMSLDLLDPSSKYQPVLIRGKIGLIMPLENWVDSDELIPVTDKNGNVIYEVDENNQLRLDTNRNPIARMKYKRVPDALGQPPIQLKADNSNTEQYVMKVTLYEDGDDSGNRVSIQLQRTKFGERVVLIPDADLLIRDAAESKKGGSEDGWAMLTNMWRGRDVIVAGTIISVNEREIDGKDTVWYGIDATMIASVDGISTPTAAPVTTPMTTPEMPTITATTVPEPAPAYNPQAAIASDTPVTTPVAHAVSPAPVAPAPAPEPVPEIRTGPVSVDSGFTQLEDAVGTVFSSMGTDTSYDSMKLSSFWGLIPAQFQTPSQRPIVEAFMEKVRNNLNAVTQPTIPAPMTPTPVQVSEPAQTVIDPNEAIRSALAAQQQAAPTDVVQQVATATATATAPTNGVKCGKCGKVLSDDEIMTHIC